MTTTGPVLEIQVKCLHGGRGAPRLLNVVTWQETDPDFAEAMTSQGPDPVAVQMLLLNDRFAWYESRPTRGGGLRTFPNPEVLFLPAQPGDPRPLQTRPAPSDGSAVAAAGALAGFRFVCPKCRRDAPIRQDRLDEWARARAQEHPRRRVHVFEI